MINDIINTSTAVVTRRYPGTLAFYHPNPSGCGCAVRFELKTAIGNREGCFFMELARQKSLPTRSSSGELQAATFDWGGKLTVKLGVPDICSLLLVLRGIQEDIGNGKGLFHTTPDATTVIRLRHGAQSPGYALEVSRKARKDGAEPVRMRLLLPDGEALALALVFEQAMMLLVYGLPCEVFATWTNRQAEAPAGPIIGSAFGPLIGGGVPETIRREEPAGVI